MAIRDHYLNIPALLAAVRAKPGMFLGRTTITGLHLFLSGIAFAEDFHELPHVDRFGGFDEAGFESWVEERYNPRRLTLNSFSLAAHLAGSDAEGFERWFVWYDEFSIVSRG